MAKQHAWAATSVATLFGPLVSSFGQVSDAAAKINLTIIDVTCQSGIEVDLGREWSDVNGIEDGKQFLTNKYQSLGLEEFVEWAACQGLKVRLTYFSNDPQNWASVWILHTIGSDRKKLVNDHAGPMWQDGFRIVFGLATGKLLMVS